MIKNFSYIFLCLIIFNSNFALSDVNPNYEKEKNISEQILQNISKQNEKAILAYNDLNDYISLSKI